MSFGDSEAAVKRTYAAAAAATGLATQPFSAGDTTAVAQAQRPGERPIPLGRTPHQLNNHANYNYSTSTIASINNHPVAPGFTPPPSAAASTASASVQAKIASIRKVWDRASNSVFQISNNVASLDALVKQLGSSKDSPDLRSRLHDLTESTRDMIKQTGADLKSLVIPEDSSNYEGRQHKMAQQKLQKDFENVLSRFQNVSKMAAKKSREYVQKARTHQQQQQNLKFRVNDDDEENSENAPLLLQQDEAVDAEVEYNESLIQEREQDLQNIERSIGEVNEIFRDLGTIVGEQQYMLDHIDSNVGIVAVNMEGATGELRIAAERQKAAQNRMCCLYTILGAVGVIVILVVFR
ncbi:hypothetical protein HK100_010890 [Physocladia obscura]|uniref:t-SNARE coiled-coil homology domain-containing protein n=1 Tax=Physocladia obscura TaxID=109957 RepID=A0AAD5T9P0_9FUNG|nr:hypothetical protein HK100_010890 [Physocladia obscura]